MTILPLSDIRILDFCTFVAGPFSTTNLGDLGADVITVETPRGADEIRDWLPGPDRGTVLSGEFTGLNRNKRSIMIDLKKEEGRRIVYELAKTADVVVENFRPGVAKKLGVDYNTMSSINPMIIYCSISDFGQSGPYRDRTSTDFVIQGMSGFVHVTGEPPPRPPCKVGIGIADLYGGLYNTVAVLAGLELREKIGRGVFLDMSLFDTIVALTSYYTTRYYVDHVDPGRTGLWHNRGGVLYGTFETKDDRYVVVARASGRGFLRLCDALDLKAFANDILSRYPNDEVAWEKAREEMVNTVGAAFKQKTAKEAVEALNRAGVLCGQVKSLGEVFRDPQVQHRKMVMEIERPPFGKVKLLANPIRGTERMWELRIPPALPGEHTDGILRELGRSEEEIARLKTDGVIKSSKIKA